MYNSALIDDYVELNLWFQYLFFLQFQDNYNGADMWNQFCLELRCQILAHEVAAYFCKYIFIKVVPQQFSYILSSCFHFITTELRACHQDNKAHRPKVWSAVEKFAKPLH